MTDWQFWFLLFTIWFAIFSSTDAPRITVISFLFAFSFAVLSLLAAIVWAVDNLTFFP